MEPVRTQNVVQEDGFIHQIKWDGIRGIVHIENDNVRIVTRKGNNCTGSYPDLALLHRQIDAHHAVLDGEMVVFDGGKPSFYHALRRNRTQNISSAQRLAVQYPAKYIVFDILFLNGKDVRTLPLSKRQQMLRTHFEDNAAAAVTDDFEDGEALFALMKEQNMEGIVSKHLSSVYTAGKKHGDWYKTKTAKKMLCVVTGIHTKNEKPVSLALSVYRNGELVRVGSVSSGLTQGDLNLLDKAMQQGDIALTCWVRFTEWTHHATMRNPVLLGFSDLPKKQANGQEISL